MNWGKHMMAAAIAAMTLAFCCGLQAAENGKAATEAPQSSEPAAMLLEKGIYSEETAGDLDAAMAIYKQIVADFAAERPAVAQAQYRLAMCLLKKGDKKAAEVQLRQLIANNGDEKELADKARKELAKLAPPRKDAVPQVLRTTPAALADDVDPSLDKLTVTFDRPMMDKSWSWTQGDQAFSGRTGTTFPESAGQVSYDAARKTCTMPVKLEPGKVYWVGINGPSHKNFKSRDGMPAKQHLILFATKGADGKPTPLPEGLVAQARQISELKTFLITFEPVAPFAPASPQELLGAFNENHPDATTHHFRTAREAGKLIGRIYVDTETGRDAVVRMLSESSKLKLVSVEGEGDAQPAADPAPSAADKREAEKLAAEGWQLWRKQAYADAEEKFQAAVEKNPASADALNGLGWAQFNQGKPLNAKEAFEKAVELDPTAAASWNGLGWIAKNDGETDAAIDYWMKAVDIAPSATASLSGLAGAYIERGQYDQAEHYYEMWLKAEPNNVDAQAGLKKAKEADETMLAGVNDWLALMDGGDFAAAWDAADPLIREMAPKEQFATVMGAIRGDWGALKGRDLFSRQSTPVLGSLPNATGGPFLVLLYNARFESKQVTETIILRRGEGETWAVMGYMIAPPDAGQAETAPAATQPSQGDTSGVPRSPKVEEATAAAEKWLALLDSDQYEESWQQAASFFRKNVSQRSWKQSLESIREPLGAMQGRKLISAKHTTNVTGAPAGQYVVIQYETSFENKPKVIETVTPMLDGSQWRVSGYFIK